MVVGGQAEQPSQMVEKEKSNLVNGVGDGISKGKGCTAPSQEDIGLMMAAPGSWSFILICSHWREALVNGSGG